MTDVSAKFPGVLAGCAITVTCLLFAPLAQAEDAASSSSVKFSGFLSVIGGKVLGNSLDDNYVGPTSINGTQCPCYIADWGNAGVYNNSFSFKPESRVGVQMNYTVNPALGFGAQIVSRGSDAKPNLQWAYGSYKFNDNWELQLGRKRIPLYYYSDFQDIGIAYPWVNAPPELYGWEATNYNGGSLRYRGGAGDSNFAASVFAGRETVKDSLYMQLYYTGTTEVTWSRLVGADFEVTNGPLTARAIYMQAGVRTVNADVGLDDSADLDAYGIALNLDFDNWFVLSELTQLNRKFTADHYTVSAPAFTIGAGWRVGNWTPFVNYAQYREHTDDLNLYAPQSFRRVSFTLRYDIGATSAWKTQIDRNTDITNNFGGNTTIFRVSYDRRF